jgi:hypothetical protein
LEEAVDLSSDRLLMNECEGMRSSKENLVIVIATFCLFKNDRTAETMFIT